MMRQLFTLASLIAPLLFGACSPSDAPGRGCPAPTTDTELLTHTEHGYCVLYPTGYTAEHPNESETVLVVGSLLNMEQPRAYIEVDDAAGRTAEQVADEVLAEFESVAPGFGIERAETTIKGEPAMVLEGLPGQDISRRIMIVHDERLYTLTFVPADEALGEVYAQVETLYNTVIGSFSFLPRE
jgi:hypothetical protein